MNFRNMNTPGVYMFSFEREEHNDIVMIFVLRMVNLREITPNYSHAMSILVCISYTVIIVLYDANLTQGEARERHQPERFHVPRRLGELLSHQVGHILTKSEEAMENSTREQQKYPKYLSNLFLVYKDYHREVEEALFEYFFD